MGGKSGTGRCVAAFVRQLELMDPLAGYILAKKKKSSSAASVRFMNQHAAVD